MGYSALRQTARVAVQASAHHNGAGRRATAQSGAMCMESMDPSECLQSLNATLLLLARTLLASK
jgi:hypothetical protein